MTRIHPTHHRAPLSVDATRSAASPAATSSRPTVADSLRQLETRGARGSQWLGLAGRIGAPALFGGVSSSVYKEALRHAEARVLPERQKPAHKAKTVTFTPEQVARVRNAPDATAAKNAVRDILQNGQKKSARDVVNHLLGSKIRSGPNKDKAAKKIFDNLAGSIATSLRSEQSAGASTAATDTAPAQRASSSSTGSTAWSSESDGDGCQDAPPPPPPPPPPPVSCVDEPTTVDIGDFVPAANAASELMSPLVFDLAGRGLQLDKGVRVAVDLDGDGDGEMVTNVDNGLGLLVFDALDADSDGAARAFFGDGTDLSGYGIESPRADGRWDDGFAALRALCEHFFLVGGDKQFLDDADLAFLQDEIGLRMRIGGLHGDDVPLSELGITRIHLGAPSQVEPLDRAARDRFGNKWMRQTGATFVIAGHERSYADLWFAVTQRATDGKTNGKTMKPTSATTTQAAASLRT